MNVKLCLSSLFLLAAAPRFSASAGKILGELRLQIHPGRAIVPPANGGAQLIGLPLGCQCAIHDPAVGLGVGAARGRQLDSPLLKRRISLIIPRTFSAKPMAKPHSDLRLSEPPHQYSLHSIISNPGFFRPCIPLLFAKHILSHPITLQL